MVVTAADSALQLLLWGQMQAMKRAGYEVECVSLDGPWARDLQRRGWVVHTMDIPRRIAPWTDVKAVLELARLFARRRPALVHTHSPKAAAVGMLAAWLAGIPRRFNTVHGLYFVGQEGLLSRAAYKWLEVFTCRLATHVLSQSAEDLDFLVREGLLPSCRLEWLGNGIDLERFDPERFGPQDRRQVRREWNIPEDAFVVGIVCRLVREKGIPELLAAFAALRRRVPQAYLVHAGFIDRSRGEEIEPESAADLGIAEGCRFLGQRDDLPRLLAAMDVYCLPSHREGYPRSVMEACAMGLPVVATDIRGSREAVLNGVNGLLVPLRDPEAIAQALVRLHDDSGLRRRLSEGARARALETFDERRVIRTILEAYERALRQR
jgi:glycosyltransferase involved in cell wall biosynthesis